MDEKSKLSTMAQLRNKNLIVGFALVGFGLLGASLPLIIRTVKGDNTVATDKPLSGTATMRGPYMNTGSRDVGPDIRYDVKTGTWHGKRNN